MPPLHIAVLGTGLMGLPIARRLIEAGHHVHAWNRTHAKAQPLTDMGASVHEQPSQAVEQAEFTISMLENGDVVGHVLFELNAAQAMQTGSDLAPVLWSA